MRGGTIVDRLYSLIRPPRTRFSPLCVNVHGIRWRDVKDAPSFREFWIKHAGFLEDTDFLAAHNARFDRRVLAACCAMSGLPAPCLPFVCTVDLARALWNIRPTKLPDVCRFLDLALDHHHAGSDADACAGIVVAALAEDPGCLKRFSLIF